VATPTAKLTELIDKTDNVEVIRDQIAAILVVETANQKVLADAASKDPRDWDMRVFVERADPWAEWMDLPETEENRTRVSPIVSVRFDSASYDPAGSDTFSRQKTVGIFNIDCYGYGVSTATTGGHDPGDLAATLECMRVVRLVRNILMSAKYTYLGMEKTVWRRWPQSLQAFQAEQQGRAVQNIQAVRLALEVQFNEFSPQVVGQPLELLTVTVTRDTVDGEVLLIASYPDT
jgi:hypothetical protein